MSIVYKDIRRDWYRRTATRVLFPPHQVSGFSFFLFRVCVYANAFSILQRQQIYIPSEEPTELADAKMLRALQHHNQMWSLHATKVIAVDLQKWWEQARSSSSLILEAIRVIISLRLPTVHIQGEADSSTLLLWFPARAFCDLGLDPKLGSPD